MKPLLHLTTASGAVVHLGKDAAGRWSTICLGPDSAPHFHAESWPSLTVALIAVYLPWQWCSHPDCPPEPTCPLCDAPQRTSAESRRRDVSADRWRIIAPLPESQPDHHHAA